MKFLPLFVLTQSALLLLGCNARAAQPARPNIIFILADDLGYGDLGVFFQNQRNAVNDRSEPAHFTPRLDAMAAEGVQLRHHYCPAPVCAPSRASLLLGVHQGHSNIRDNQFDKALEQNHTLATVLKGGGYATAAIGKWGLQGAGTSAADWPAYPTKRGFDFYFGYVRHRDGHGHYPKEDGKELWENEREVSADFAGCYTTDLFTARAKKWISDQHATQPQKPFFLYLAYDTPHAKLQLPPGAFPQGAGHKGGVQWVGKPGRMINTSSDTPDSYVHPDYADATWDHDRDVSTPEQPWPDVYKRYATSVRRIDDCVGDLVQLLKDLAIDDNTLIVLTTDNGPSKESYLPENFEPSFFRSFGQFNGIKRDLLEGGIRVGALARWPGGAPGKRVSDVPSQFHDWMPTFAELAGVPAPARCDGTSLLPAITGRGTQKTPLVYIEYSQNQKTPDYPQFEPAHRGRVRKQMQAIRAGDFIGVRYNVRTHDDPFEIYNIVADPKQTKDLAAAQPELQQQMHDTVLRVRRPDPTAPRPYDSELVPPVSTREAVKGVKWQAFSQSMPWLARLEDLAPAAEGTVSQFDVADAPAGTKALLFTGYIDAPADGEYTFMLPEGATALLRVHDATVLDAGFAPASTGTHAKVALKAGPHPFRFYWQAGARPPRLEWSGPSGTRQVVVGNIPTQADNE